LKVFFTFTTAKNKKSGGAYVHHRRAVALICAIVVKLFPQSPSSPCSIMALLRQQGYGERKTIEFGRENGSAGLLRSLPRHQTSPPSSYAGEPLKSVRNKKMGLSQIGWLRLEFGPAF
jgi:hypothetical protein